MAKHPAVGSLPEFMVRVKLPDPNGYHSGPSGDTEYDDAYHKALDGAVPEGFEVAEKRLGVRWPMDSSGMTYVPLRCVDEESVLGRLHKKLTEIQGAAAKVTLAVGDMAGLLPEGMLNGE